MVYAKTLNKVKQYLELSGKPHTLNKLAKELRLNYLAVRESVQQLQDWGHVELIESDSIRLVRSTIVSQPQAQVVLQPAESEIKRPASKKSWPLFR